MLTTNANQHLVVLKQPLEGGGSVIFDRSLDGPLPVALEGLLGHAVAQHR